MPLLRATLVIAIVASLAHAQVPKQTPTPTPTPTPTATAKPTPSPTGTPTPSPSPTPPPKHLEVEWRKELAPSDENNAAAWIVAGEAHVFVPGPGGTVDARTVKDGSVAWSWTDRCVVPPAVAGANLAIVTTDSLIVVDQASGHARWRVPIESTGSPVVAVGWAERIAVLFQGGIQTWDSSGQTGWHATFTGIPITNVAMAGSLLVFGTDQPALIGIDAASGDVRWQIPLPTKPRPIAATAERIYFGGEDNNLYAYQIDGKQEQEWRPFRRPLAIGAPLVEGRVVYFALLDNSIRGFTAGGGTELSDHVLESRPLAGPLRLADTIGLALTDSRVAEVGTKDGKPVGPPSGAAGGVWQIAAAVSLDRSRIYTVTIATDSARTLVAWTHSSSGEGKH